MQVTVQKFGGTSVHDAAALERLATIVGAAGAGRAVVVSAMRGVTDALLVGAQRAGEGDPSEALDLIAPQLARHVAAARELLPAAAAAEVEGRVERAGREVADLLRIVANLPGTRLPLHDEIVSYGERLSAFLVTRVLQAQGVPASEVDARRCIITSGDHGRAVPLPGPTEEGTRAALLPPLREGMVPVMGGFIGSAAGGATTTLGRGGSDYTAALVGAALRAREVQIWTDVTGFLTADPRVVGAARPIPHLSYDEAAELAYFGARVLHPKTIQPAVERSVPVRVCNSHRPEAAGTRIDDRAVVSPAVVKAIAHKPGVTIVHVTSTRMLGAYGFLRALFEVFDRHRTAVDVVSTSEVSVSLSLEDTADLPAIVEELEALGSVRVAKGHAIVCAVGQGLGTTPGVAARVFGTLSDINIALVSQGASRINLTFVVREPDVEEVVRRLHGAFFP